MEKQEILTERNVVVEVLERYKKLPYLWNPTHKLYTNKNARRQGLEIMLESWRKLEPNATIECIRKKLNNWRAAYRRERKKVEESMRITTEPDEIHKPNLWYYDHLTFIHDDCPVLGKDSDDDHPGHDFLINDEGEDADEGSGDDDDGGEDHHDDVEDHNEDGDDTNDEDDEVPIKKPRVSAKRKSNDRLVKRDFADSAQVTVHANSSHDENSADLFGRSIGSQLKDVSKFQRCLAEKLISEVMFYAKLEQLTIGTSINLEPPPVGLAHIYKATD